jgi:hypothetical protein
MKAAVVDMVGLRDALCHQEMLEQLGLVAIYADVAQQMVEIGDESGADYALRRMATHAKAAITARNHLRAPSQTEAA